MIRSAVALLLLLCAVVAAELFVVEQSKNPEEFRTLALPAWEGFVGGPLEFRELDARVRAQQAFVSETAYMVTMEDGVRLNTIVSFPRHYDGSPMPIVLDRTPYDAAVQGLIVGTLFHSQGYITVTQDMRGRYGSEGVWSMWRDAARDGFDTINWITEQEWCNGDVMAFGISADGIGATFQEGHYPPPVGLKAQSLWVSSGSGYQSAYYNGAYRESLINGWLEGLDEAWYIPVMEEHEVYTAWWLPVDLTTRWNNTNVPAIHSGGWFDIFGPGTLNSYLGYQYGGEGARGNQYLVMNPLGHCPGGQYRFPRGRNVWMLTLTYHMFEQAQTGAAYAPESLPICFYVMGPDPRASTRGTDQGNFWACMNDFPTPTNTNYYMYANGTLAAVAPRRFEVASPSEFVYDPTNPVPTLGGNNLILPTCGPYDQTELEARDDVLLFTSPVLTEPVAIMGNVSVTLFVSSSANDTDFTVKLTDVYDGKSYNILDNVIRMRWRDSLKSISYMVPGQVYEVTINMSATSYVFNAGHQIRLDVSSSNYPRFSPNLNNGNTLAERGEPVIATNQVYHSHEHPSTMTLPVVPLAQLQSAAPSPFE